LDGQTDSGGTLEEDGVMKSEVWSVIFDSTRVTDPKSAIEHQKSNFNSRRCVMGLLPTMNTKRPSQEKAAPIPVDNDVVEVDTPEREIYRMDQEGDPEVMLAILEKKAELAPRFKAAQEVILASQTYGSDWTEFDGTMCLSAAGAERVGRLFDIQYFETSWLKEEFTDSVGKGYRYVYECKAALGSRITYAMGVYSSRDAFLGQCDGQYKALEDVDENNIRRAAYSLMKGNAIKSLLGLRGIPRDQWQEMMERMRRQPPKAIKAQPAEGAPRTAAEADRAKQKELADLCIALANAGRTVVTNDYQSFRLAPAAETAAPLERAKRICVTVSSFRNDRGKVVPGRGAKSLRGKWLERALKHARQVHAQLPASSQKKERSGQPRKEEKR
jgi:hypothetical protein